MAAQKALDPRVEEEAQEDLARIAQHHDEGHQRTAGTTNGEMAEVPPVHLALLARKTAQAQIGLGRPARTMTGDDMPEVIGTTAVHTNSRAGACADAGPPAHGRRPQCLE